MPHCRPEDIPDANERWPDIPKGHFRSVKWGDMEVGYTCVAHPLDCTEQYQTGGYPGGVCQCPHYFYIFEGRIRARYPNTNWPDEIAVGGEVCFFPAGHVLIYEEPSRVLELNPAAALQTCIDLAEQAAKRAKAEAAGP